MISVLVFSLEYVLRIWACTERGEFAEGRGCRLCDVVTLMALVDLAAILPFYLPLFFPFDARMLRLIRLVRLLRLLKVIRYSESLRVFTDVCRMKKSELAMVFLVVLFLLVFPLAVIYHVEQEAQPIAFSSIPAAIIALLGIGLFALPAGILGSGFVGALRRKSNSTFYCPHCSEEVTRK